MGFRRSKKRDKIALQKGGHPNLLISLCRNVKKREGIVSRKKMQVE